MEFHADLVLPYIGKLNDMPMHGMYLLIQLESQDEAVLGRITSVFSDGKLSSGAGEDYNIRAAKSHYAVSESLKEEYLKYRVNVRVLGGLKLDNGKVVFVPSFRRIPSVGAPVSFPSDDVLRELANSDGKGSLIGLYALGEYIYAGDKAEEYGLNKPWMNIMSPEIDVRFDVNAMVSRRTFVFARAGFGKSNLNKLLFSQLYKTTPVKRKGDKEVPVGTIIFDRDGEYFWPDDNKRPGLCDVEELRDNLVVFTGREAPNDFYGSFVAGSIKIDLRELPASVVISLAVSQERQEQQNIRKLKALNKDNWKKIVNIAYEQGYNADQAEVKAILGIQDGGDAEAAAAISNITNVVKMLHDPASRFMESLLMALKDGKLCIVDMSRYTSDAALVLSGIVLSRIFEHNQKEFTKANSEAIPTIVVLEEAQSVLTSGTATAPFISWVKEGRKYDLGALMITQQPGSISTDILSQGDNWFVFHLLSDRDLQDVRRANAHFSNDILSSLLNEPIVGQGVFWSSVDVDGNGAKPYPIPLRVLSFEHTVKLREDRTQTGKIENYVTKLKARMQPVTPDNVESCPEGDVKAVSPPPMRESIAEAVANDLKGNPIIMANFDRGIPWGVVKQKILESMDSRGINLVDQENVAYKLVRPVLCNLFGEEDVGWRREKRDTSGRIILFVVRIP